MSDPKQKLTSDRGPRVRSRRLAAPPDRHPRQVPHRGLRHRARAGGPDRCGGRGGRPPPRHLAHLSRGDRDPLEPRRRRHHQPRHRPRPADQRVRRGARRDRRRLRPHPARAGARHLCARAAGPVLRGAAGRRRGRRGAGRPQRSGARGVVPGSRRRRRRPRCRPRTSSSAGTSTCGCRTTRASAGCRPCSTPAARWSATPRRRRSGWSPTPTATGPASAPGPVAPEVGPGGRAREPTSWDCRFHMLGRLSHSLDAGWSRRRRLSHAHRDSCTHATRELRSPTERTRVTPRRPPGRGVFCWADTEEEP